MISVDKQRPLSKPEGYQGLANRHFLDKWSSSPGKASIDCLVDGEACPLIQDKRKRLGLFIRYINETADRLNK